MKTTIRALKNIDYALWAVLAVTALFPTVYNSVRIFFLGTLPSSWGYDIASQLAWVDVIYEVIQEALILPVFYVLGMSINRDLEFRNKLITGTVVVVGLYSLLGILLLFFTPALVRMMAQEVQLISRTITYIRLEAVAKIPGILFKFLMAAVIIKERRRAILKLLIVQALLTIALDAFIVRNAPSSLSLGVNGIAVSNFISGIIMSYLAWRVVYKGLSSISIKLSFSWLREWFRVGKLSGLESFIRNTAFIVMILRLVNIIQEPGTFWLSLSFIWGWLLLPVLSLGDVIRQEAAKRIKESIMQPYPYLIITFGIVLFWAATMPLWGAFLRNVLGITDYHLVLRITVMSIPFYIIFAFNNVIDNIFYGTGRTDLMLIQSLFVNLLFYGGAFILYKLGHFSPGITGITLMFGIGMALDSLITFFLYWKVFRNEFLR